MTPEEEENRRNIRRVQRQIDEAYDRVIQVISGASGLKMVGDTFRLDDNPVLKRKIQEALKGFRIEVEAAIVNGIQVSFQASQKNFTDLVYRSYDGRTISQNVKDLINATYERPLNAFLNRTIDGLKLSDRVWNLSNQLQREIEWSLFSGISEGQSSQTISRSIRRFLRNPDALFRRVRNAKGNLVLSRAARQFKPGQGVYRSSYKNAMRVSRTEVNTAYRTADHEKFSSIPFVLGVEVRLSDQHIVFDVCDIVAGIYPPWFKFTMWHIQCICYAVPVLPSKEEFRAYQDAVLDGTEKDFKFKDKIENPPDGFFNWLEENKERVNGWKHLPPFLKDNPRFKTLLE
ncbi:hypothetical protein [Pleomorphovibrio marinus]|uniref:hypothetical protein n=1 Tax=Pleomorphovibrio marinus TaxID=2164132 RepID=UPI000E0ADAC9|nr:hypothetical protein [Pleomorphovibrio marinus]